MLGILGNIKEYFWRSREHAVAFLGTGELNKSEFKEHLNLFWGNKGETINAIFFVIFSQNLS